MSNSFLIDIIQKLNGVFATISSQNTLETTLNNKINILKEKCNLKSGDNDKPYIIIEDKKINGSGSIIATFKNANGTNVSDSTTKGKFYVNGVEYNASIVNGQATLSLGLKGQFDVLVTYTENNVVSSASATIVQWNPSTYINGLNEATNTVTVVQGQYLSGGSENYLGVATNGEKIVLTLHDEALDPIYTSTIGGVNGQWKTQIGLLPTRYDNQTISITSNGVTTSKTFNLVVTSS